MNAEGVARETFPASTLCTISSSNPVYLIFSWFSYSNVLFVFQSASMLSLSPMVPFTFTWTSWLKSGSFRTWSSVESVVWSDFVERNPALMSTAPVTFRLISFLPNMLKRGFAGTGMLIFVMFASMSPMSFLTRTLVLRASAASASRRSDFSLSAIYSLSEREPGIFASTPPTVSRKRTPFPVESSTISLRYDAA